MQIDATFASFILSDTLNIDNDNLISYSYELKKEESGVVKSNFLGWQSDILTKPNSEVGQLNDIIIEKINLCKAMLGFRPDTQVSINNIWININQKFSFNRPHVHPECVLAGVYYVKCNEDSGKLVFRHPSLIQQYTINEDIISEYTSFNAGTWSILPEAGKLIIFPAWLEHYVEPNVSDEDRISIAFNIDIKKD